MPSLRKGVERATDVIPKCQNALDQSRTDTRPFYQVIAIGNPLPRGGIDVWSEIARLARPALDLRVYGRGRQSGLAPEPPGGVFAIGLRTKKASSVPRCCHRDMLTFIGGMRSGNEFVVTARRKGRNTKRRRPVAGQNSSKVLPCREFWKYQGGHGEELGADEQTTMSKTERPLL